MPDSKDNARKPVSGTQRRAGAARKGEDLSNYVFGKVQPQAIPLEEAVLGAVMLDKNALTIIIDILQPESFYLEAHQEIYRAMRQLFDRSQPIDLLTVMEELKKNGVLENVGGAAYIAELTHRVASAANIEYHARIIAQKYIQRELIRVSTNIIRDAFEDTSDVFELLDDAEQGLYNIAQNNMSRGYESTGTLAGKMLKQIEELKGKKDGLTGVPTGFTALDRLTSGWQPSDLIIVAARPAMGKTGFVLSMARNAAIEFKKPVALFSLEMASLQLVLRLVSMEAEISGSKLRNGQLEEDEWKRLHKAVERISEAPILIDDTAGINIFELRAKARRMKIQHDIQLIVIDYLQLMSGGPDSQRGNREQEISSISRSLKALAKELNVPVIALSQLSRAVEVRGGTKRPQLSDLRESGAIEQDADIVSFIYRPEYYNITEDEGVSLKGIAEIIVAKHRNGAVDTVKLRFTDKYARFSDLDEFSFEQMSFPSDPSAPGAQPTMIIRPSRMNDDEDIPF
jgi:replicative DNA helicase